MGILEAFDVIKDSFLVPPPPAPTIKHLKYLLLQLLDYLLVKAISEYPSPYPGFQPILAARDTYVCFTKYI